jgi:hypothetical protein
MRFALICFVVGVRGGGGTAAAAIAAAAIAA